jgi:hypothetical protein
VTQAAVAASSSVQDLLARAADCRKRNDWAALGLMAGQLPEKLEGAWLTLADDVVFALSQGKRFITAIKLGKRAYSAEPSQRRASGLAYIHYAALMELRAPRRGRDKKGHQEAERGMSPQDLKDGFRTWIEQALKMFPKSIKDLYRLGVFEAQLESAHDKVALKAFLQAIDSYNELSDEQRARRHDLAKYHARALYAGARSALRLKQYVLARKLCFSCVREDQRRHHVEEVHKMSQACKVCLATGELDHAERAARLALDAKGPPMRDWIYGFLAEISRRRDDLAGAALWIEKHVRAERRSAALWRQLGDIQCQAGQDKAAVASWQSSLLKDRAGRHLTLNRLGHAFLARGEPKEAERSFTQANEFRRRTYNSEDAGSLDGLAAALQAQGKKEAAAQARAKAAALSRNPAPEPVDPHDDEESHTAEGVA